MTARPAPLCIGLGALAFLTAAVTATVARPSAQPLPGTAPGAGQPAGPPAMATPPPVPSILPAVSPSPSPGASTLETTAPGASPAASALPVPAASPGPAGQTVPTRAIVRFTGQLLDMRNGYVYFTTADAFKTAATLRVIDLDTGEPTTRLVPAAPLFARATLDPATGEIAELALTKRKLPMDAAYQQAYAQAHAYAVTGSPTIPAPELRGVRLTGRAVAVTFFVQVPPTTPLSDAVYITTDASGWVANAMKMDRIDALHYRLTRTYASGTKFAYRFTRGTWTSVEVGEDGLQGDPHQFFVPEVDAKRLTDVVYRWSDQNPSQPQVGPDSIPTPFNPNPFGSLPSANQHPGIPVPSPTPRP